MSSSNSVAARSSAYLQSLVDYLLDVKPYHTKLSVGGAVSETYVFSDSFNVSITDGSMSLKAFLGADLMPVETTLPGVRERESFGWAQERISDGVRRTWPLALVSNPNLASQAHLERFVAGQDDVQEIQGLSSGAFNQKRWDGPGITDVRKNNVHLQDTIDYTLSHGAFSFDVLPTRFWLPHDVNQSTNTFNARDGRLQYSDVTNSGGTIKNIYSDPTRTTYEEFKLICTSVEFDPDNDIDTATLTVYSSVDGFTAVLGTVKLGDTFTLLDSGGQTRLEFTFDYAPGQTNNTATIGNEWILTPKNRLTIFPSAPEEVWTLIKCNPIGFAATGEPVFTPAVPRDDSPAIEVHMRSVEDTTNALKVGVLPISSGGSGYVPGTHTNVQLVGGTGTGALATVVVSGSGIISSVTVTDAGSGYEVGDRFFITAVAVVGTSGTGFVSRLPEAMNATWTVTFLGDGTYDLDCSLYEGYPKNIPLINGCSYKDEHIAFTLIPTATGWNAGDMFRWTIKPAETHGHYRVFGSVSGWQDNATVGKWYWNGKIGFKIPKLSAFAEVHSSTIATSTDITNGVWNTAVSNAQSLRSVTFVNNGFYVAGNQSIVGASANGLNWTSAIEDVFQPTDSSQRLLVQGADGFIAYTTDGDIWISEDSKTDATLHASTMIPNFLSTPSAPNSINCFIVVGDNGTIITSTSGAGWAKQISGVDNNLYDVAWSEDGIFVVGAGGTILKSLDRITWEPVVSNTSNTLRSIIYVPDDSSVDPEGHASPGTFIVVGDSGTILRSTDGGETWNNLAPFGVSSAASASFTSVAYGDGMFVAVGPSAFVAYSEDGETWTPYSAAPFNSIAYGNGVWVAVGGSSNLSTQFTPLSKVSVMAEPSTYTITFTKRSDSENNTPGEATVYNNIYGYRANLKTGEPWSDEFVSFQLDTIPGSFEFGVGDVVKVHLTTSYKMAAEASYDSTPYEKYEYDAGTVTINNPYSYNNELFPLYHAHGLVIVEDAVDGDELVIDKAFNTRIKFKINGASANFPELGAVNDWLPMYFRSFDVSVNGVGTSNAEFSDLELMTEAYSAATGQRIFTIRSPRYEKTNRSASSTLTFDQDFFDNYMKFNTRYSIHVHPDQVYGQRLRVKVAENLSFFARFRLELAEGPADNYYIYHYDNDEESETYGQYILVHKTTPELEYPFNIGISSIMNSFQTTNWLTFAEGPATNYNIFRPIRNEEGNFILPEYEEGSGEQIQSVELTNKTNPPLENPFSIEFMEGGAMPITGYGVWGFDTFLYGADSAYTFGYNGDVHSIPALLSGFSSVQYEPDQAPFETKWGTIYRTGVPTDWVLLRPTNSIGIHTKIALGESLTDERSENESPRPPIEVGSKFAEGLSIVMTEVSDTDPDNPNIAAGDRSMTIIYDFRQTETEADDNPVGKVGLRVSALTGTPNATQYIVKMENVPPGLNNYYVIASENDLETTQSEPIVFESFNIGSGTTIKDEEKKTSFAFSLPEGISAPFRLWII